MDVSTWSTRSPKIDLVFEVDWDTFIALLRISMWKAAISLDEACSATAFFGCHSLGATPKQSMSITSFLKWHRRVCLSIMHGYISMYTTRSLDSFSVLKPPQVRTGHRGSTSWLRSHLTPFVFLFYPFYFGFCHNASLSRSRFLSLWLRPTAPAGT